jgi:phosphate-selective porin OprO/OprP
MTILKPKTPLRLALAILVCWTWASQGSRAQATDEVPGKIEAPEGPSGWDRSIWPGPKFRAFDGGFTGLFHARFLLDMGYVGDKNSVGSADDWDIKVRVIRAGLTGGIGKHIDYKVNLSVDNGDFNVRDAFIQHATKGGLILRAGQYKVANSMESETSILHISLVERAGFINAFGLKRAVGFGAKYGRKNWDAQIGIFNGSNLNDQESNEKYVGSARVAVYPQFGLMSGFHVAASVRFRKFTVKEGLSEVQYRHRPHSHLEEKFYVDTGLMDNISSDQMAVVELAGVTGPWWVAAEMGWLAAKIMPEHIGLFGGKSKAHFKGGYIEGGWFATGETKKKRYGRWERIEVARPVFQGGWGAWALVARYDYIDLVDGKALIFGGTQRTAIVGVNWHLTNYLIVKTNLSRSVINKAFDAPLDNGLVNEEGHNKVHTVTMRLQAEF